MRTIFVVDDEENIRYIISEYLLREGFTVETFGSVEAALARLQSGFPDMFILDIMLPGKDGLEFCRDIRSRSGVPVIFISARGEEIDRVLGLELGGDDYLTKPFSPRELVARVRSIFRRASIPIIPEELLETGNLRINPNDRRITVENSEVMLTPKEYELLLLLAQQPQRTFNRQELLDRVWGCDYVGGNRAVDDLVKRLRKKLRESGSSNNVKTIWGYGYRFED
ncbi:MAG TPA: response regulator transcription factor [Syntrophomonadaceae bacterium]|nr:response regulator transcription factor [Syntrophomonadaceae bacterium]